MLRPTPRPMSDTSPGFTTQRTLAAIIFTDAVSFSARVQQDEVGTLKQLHRDFQQMRDLCARHDGAVLKTTGDGLLMTFASAVQAVGCALAMQRHFAAAAKEGDPAKLLQHRIGIHLGDILVQNQDVMGDGVNIASRLQAEAEPGGICISQTVYDVVKNKLELKAVSLGPRELKNITQAVPVYRILLEAQALESGHPPVPVPAGTTPAVSAPAAAPKPSSRLPWVLAAAGALALVFAAGVVFNRRQSRNDPPAPAAQPATAVAGPTTPAAANPGAAGPPQSGAAARGQRGNAQRNAGGQAGVSTAAPAPVPESVPAAAARRDLTQNRQQYLDTYDFAGLVKAIQEGPEAAGAGRLGQQQLLRSAEQMQVLKGWLESELRRYSRQRPLAVTDIAGDTTRNFQVFLTPDNKVVTILNGALQPREWNAVPPAVLGNVIVSALRQAGTSAPRDAVLGAQAFSRTYNLPAMLTAMPGLQQGGQNRAGRQGAAAP